MRRLWIVALLVLGGCAGTGEYFRDAGAPPAPGTLTLASWPHKELWTGVVFNGDKIGFTRRVLRPAADGSDRWEIESEASMRIRFLGVDKRISLHALDRVRPDLTLEEFHYRQDIDGSPLQVSGRSDGRKLQYSIVASGSREDREAILAEKLYPSSALSYLPAIEGMAVGRRTRYLVFEGESQKLDQAEIEVNAWESSTLFEGQAFRLTTQLLGLSSTTWMAPDGRPLLERAMNGVLLSALEDEATARRYLVEASLNKRDALVDFSLLRAGPLEEPRRVSRMEITVAGVPAAFEVPSEGGQQCVRRAQVLTCSVDRAAALAQDDPAKYLKPTLAAPSNLGEITQLSRSIVGNARGENEKIARILLWMDVNIAKEAVDSFTAVDVLRERRAECQGHAYLFAALARAAGVPVRVVNGFVYSGEHGGFLYHAWNEAWIAGRGWLPVDATFGQPVADATHFKLLEGETSGDLLPLAALLGRIQVSAVRAVAHW
jgi:hypothetical protein